MAKEGFEQSINFNIDDLIDKAFHSYRKTKTHNEVLYYKWNPFNLVNKHLTRNSDHAYDLLMAGDVPKSIYDSKPDFVLNIGNEYLSFMLMDELRKCYEISSMDMPKRHFWHRFIRDFR